MYTVYKVFNAGAHYTILIVSILKEISLKGARKPGRLLVSLCAFESLRPDSYRDCVKFKLKQPSALLLFDQRETLYTLPKNSF
jgi:hypothetical protein